ncbi:MAG: SIMPL domain-containing protein [Aestuariivirga sp.]|uniref:SIMPL domain-containing protein n=1 Tax=Aestuariivirga sp. TaxID=2650926 RepID=UPI0038D1325C
MQRLFLAAAGLASLLAVSTPGFADEARMPRTITLSGHGETKAAPDMAFVTSGVVTAGATAADALAANTQSMNSLFAALKEAGIAEKDMQTSNFSVQPRYDFNNGTAPPKLVGYEVSNTVTVTIRKLAGLGPLLDRLVTAGSNQIQGIGFMVSAPDVALDAARQLAAADATRKAKVYAAAMGVDLGKVISISEGGAQQPQPPLLRAGPMMADAAGAPVPVAAGEQNMSVDVTVTWEIR